ncbi:hypothetical protein RFD78_000789 [Klebsiella aerogenes]|nr:hypothetical protein [Klebsiella aerogenes]ELA0226267.1 hypothetical protein [Klebsiella aerogenes]
MGKVTFVVEFLDGEEPSVSSGTKIFGGKLSSVQWSDYRDDLLSPNQRDVVIEALNELTRDDVDVDCHQVIIDKLEFLTL